MVDVLILARIQFAFTISFHIMFPAFTIGLASWLAVLELLWLKTGRSVYNELYQQWVKIFAVSFAMGVVSGIVMSYEFGTNWSEFSRIAGNVIGPSMAYEVMTAFFLEASFLGVMLFGLKRVSPKMHFLSTLIVAIGTLISAFWILSVNSWMHTPQGYRIAEDGVLFPTNWLEIIFNPSFPYRLAHMVSATYLNVAFVVAGVASYYLIQKRHTEHAAVMLRMALLIMVTFGVAQPIIGDLHGLNTLEHQPAKIAAMEGIWESKKGADLILFGVPNERQEKTEYVISIPKLSSLILTHSTEGEVKGLKEWERQDRPPVVIVFYAFRVMVGIGLLMLLTGITGAFLLWRSKLETSSWFHKWCVLFAPSGFIAILAGWFVTETGRQPYIVYGLLRTSDMLSPVSRDGVLFSFLVIFLVYSTVFSTGIYYIFRLMVKGPQEATKEPVFGTHGVKTPPIITDI
ncbi:MAG: cytochrome ubiquinol oxidase subunit I [Proteobacteria bacterium]|nr:cytochrome ubiquinol oxidase subunit I [Pseudomonadota bacterium]